MIAIGIDPGLSGALVELDEAGNVGAVDTPTIPLKGKSKRTYDVRGMSQLLEGYTLGLSSDGRIVAHEVTVFVEAQQPMPFKRKGPDGQPVMTGSAQALFGMGYGFGVWIGLIVAHGLRYELVHPRTWQKSMLAGVPGEGKARSLLAASRLFPTLELKRPRGRVLSLDGRSDAALIALWGLRRMRGEK